MFSHDVFLRTSDSHPIYDLNGTRINNAKNILLGNHVWIGMQSLILKGTIIGDNVIVAARSTVTNTSESNPNIILAGSPAKQLKHHIQWERTR